jgi:signal transduction histidine kinase
LAAIGQTIATLSHHIKNILQGIRGGSYLIEMGLGQHDEEVVRKGWNMVERNQNKISSLVMDMLTFSKEREPELVPSDLNSVTAEVVELMQSRAEQLSVALTFAPAAEMPMASFDPEGLHRAILNVVTNALDAASERETGTVQVAAAHLSDRGLFQVIVQDNGPGIAAEDIEKIFTPFQSKKGSRGTGLGLPVSQKILKEHGGQILVDSAPGKGAKFTLEFAASIADSAVHKTYSEPVSEMGDG